MRNVVPAEYRVPPWRGYDAEFCWSLALASTLGALLLAAIWQAPMPEPRILEIAEVPE